MSSNMGKKRVMIQPKEPQFLSIILHSDHLLHGKLAIPRRFMREYGNSLSGSVLIKVPSGMKWKVALIKSGDDTLFGNGWEEFVQYHGISYGHMIFFQYEGGCSFRAIIFNMTATEIMYPRGSMDTAGEEEQDTNPEMVDEEVKEEEDANSKVKVEDHEGEECPPFNHRTTSGRTRVENRKKTLTFGEKDDALQRADAFKSANPFFKIVLQPSYIKRRYLPLPARFCDLHIGEQCASAVVSCPSGNSWPVGFHKSENQTRIASGWTKIINDNGLEVGDVCVLELIEKTTTKTSFKLVIFRAAEDPQLS